MLVVGVCVLISRWDLICAREGWSAPRGMVQPDSLYAEQEAMAVVATVPRNWAVDRVDSSMLTVALAAALVLRTG